MELSTANVPRTSLYQTLQRPVWEPPDIDITSVFEREYWVDFLKNIKLKIPDPALRCAYLDLSGETIALAEYVRWVRLARKAMTDSADRERSEFYIALERTARIDLCEAEKDFKSVSDQIWPPQSEVVTQGQGPVSEQERPAADESSTTKNCEPGKEEIHDTSTSAIGEANPIAGVEGLLLLSPLNNVQILMRPESNDTPPNERTSLMPKKPAKCCAIL